MATVGDTGAPSTNTVYYDALLTTTLNNYAMGGTLVDNIFKDSAFLAAMREFGGVTHQDGGERIAMPLMHAGNSTVKSYAGYDTLDTTPQEGISTAFEEWKEIAGTISISRKEERQNSGEARIINLLEGKIKQAEMQMTETLNTQLLQGTVSGTEYIAGNSAKDLQPIGHIIRKLPASEPTDSVSVGNISASGESWWRTNAAVLDNASADTGGKFGLNVTTYAGTKVALRRMNNYCSRGGGGQPNLAIGDQITYETYENALDVNVRFTNTKLADMGFDNVKIRGSALVWDEMVPGLDTGDVAGASGMTGTVFFVNTKFMKLVIDSQTDVVTTPFIEPENQTAKTAKILFMGNLASNNQRKHGVVYALSQSIVA